MRQSQEMPTSKITVVRWTDEDGASQSLGSPMHDSRSPYVESFWLGVLGPSTTMLLRHLNNELDHSPVGFVLHYEELAVQLGIRGTGKQSPFTRSMQRLFQFDMARMVNPTRMMVRQAVPTLSRRHVAKLPDPLRRRHDYFLSQITVGQRATESA